MYLDRTYPCSVKPQREAVSGASLDGKMVRIHCSHLAAVISRFIGMFIVHVIRDPDLGEYQRMIPHVPQALFPEEFELVTQAIANCSFTDLDSEGWCEIFATENSYHINIV